jgi:hypothetical protein
LRSRWATWFGADGALLGLERPLNRLADPEGRVGRELVALAPIELLGGADQAEDSFLDQIQQVEVLAHVAAGVRDDQPEVRVDQPLLGLEVPSLDPLGEIDLLLLGEQGVAAHLVEEELQSVRGLLGELAFCPPRRAVPSVRSRPRSGGRRLDPFCT